MDESEIGKALGESGFTDLVAAFYQRVQEDDLLRSMYPDQDWDGAETRLRDFLIYRFGLSDRYIQERGHPRLKMRHAPFSIGIAERDRWLELMQSAMQETNVSEDVCKHLDAFFQHVADFMRNQ